MLGRVDEVSDEFGDRPFIGCGPGAEVGASVEDPLRLVRGATEHGEHVGRGLLAQVFRVGGVERPNDSNSTASAPQAGQLSGRSPSTSRPQP